MFIKFVLRIVPFMR